MINKKSICFLTLFSLILVLSVYYITMPSELLLDTNNLTDEEPKVDIEETSILTMLQLEEEEKNLKELKNLNILLNSDKPIEEKNEAYNKIKDINNNKAESNKLTNKIKNKFNLESFIKLNNNQIEVVIKSEKNDATIANKIIRCIQEEYNESKYITVRFIK